MSEYKTGNKRISYLDVAKGIGIVAVVVGHSIRADVLPAQFISMWHMPLFFFLSGVCFNAERYCSEVSGKFVVSRSRSLLQPLIVAILLFGFISLITGYGYYSFGDILDMRLPFALWFLLTLFCSQMVYWLMGLTLGKWFGKMEPLLVMGMALLSSALDNMGAHLPFSLENVPLAVSMYGFGHIVRRYVGDIVHIVSTKRPWQRWGIILAQVAVVLAFILYSGDAISFCDNHLPQPWVLALVVSLCGIDGVMRISSEIDTSSHRHIALIAKILRFLGCNSLTILIFHMWWMRLAKDFLRPLIGIGIEPILVWPLVIATIYAVNRFAPWMVGKKAG